MTPPSDREEILCAMFESFCATTIRNFGRNLKRAKKNQQKHDGTNEESVEYLISLLSSKDKYASEQFVLDVDGLPCVLENELLYKALLSLPDRERRVILYDFWYDWKDGEISKKLEVTVRTVYNLRQRAFKKSVHIMSYTGKDETPELTYALIQRAVCGDEAALEMILRHFDAYINAVASEEKVLPSGEVIEEVDEDIKIQIQMRLVEVIPKWRKLI